MAELEKPLKILQVIDRLDAGGAERVMVDLSNLLDSYGNQVTTLALLEHGELGQYLNPTIKQVDLNRLDKFARKYMKRVRKLAENHDVLHVHMRHNLKYVWLVKKLYRFSAPIIFHDHYGKINIDQKASFMLKRALKDCYYIGVSNQLSDWAKSVVRLPAIKVFCLSNIIRKKELEDLQKKSGKKIKLVMVSNIRKEKNIEFGISVVTELIKNHKVSMTIYGTVVDKEYYKALKLKIEKNKIKDLVNFVHDCSDIQPELLKFDVAIHTALSETGPLVLIEYLAQGLPFVTYNTGEVVKQIGRDAPELIADNFDVSDWTEKIVMLKKNKESQHLTSIYNNYYSEENYYHKCLEIYQKSLIY